MDDICYNETSRGSTINATTALTLSVPISEETVAAISQPTLPPLPIQDGVRFAHVPDFPGYAASDDGRIWSCLGRGRRPPYARGEWRERKGYICHKGYHRMLLRRSDGKYKNYAAHQLIMFAFVGPPTNGNWCCCHHDDDHTNNRLSNLRWGTQRNNSDDSIRNGSRAGEKNPMASLLTEHVLNIRKLAADG